MDTSTIIVVMLILVVVVVVVLILSRKGVIPPIKKFWVKIPGFEVGSEIHPTTQKGEKKEITPDISIGCTTSRTTKYPIIKNVGDEDIESLEVYFEWKQSGKNESRKAQNFFHEDQDPVLTYSEDIDYLHKDQTRKISHMPTISDDGKVIVVVRGIGSQTNQPLEKQKVIEVNKY